MIEFDFEALQKVDPAHGFLKSEAKRYAQELPGVLDLVKSRGQGFYETLDDQQVIDSIKNYAIGVQGKYRDVVILGIGGSALGAICLHQTLGDLFGERVGDWPRLTVLDNIDPVLIFEFEKNVDLSSTLFLVITKSGETPETLAQYLYFRNRIDSWKLNWLEHFVFVTGPGKGLLRQVAAKNPNLPIFDIPENVGGRFSVLTVVGLLPAALIGIDIEKLIKGAKTQREYFLTTDFKKNMAFQLAIVQHSLYQRGKNITVMFPYAQKLLKLADWYRQLLAESIGKENDRAGQKVNVGITPVISLGVTDQHSQNQLYQEGPNDKFYIFMNVANPSADLNIPNPQTFGNGLEYLQGVTFGKLLKTEMEGTIDALLTKDRPIVRIIMESLDAENLGELLLFFEGSIAFLGELLNVDAFDQPGVELSKKLTKKLLKK